MEAGIMPINPVAIKFGFLEVHLVWNYYRTWYRHRSIFGHA